MHYLGMYVECKKKREREREREKKAHSAFVRPPKPSIPALVRTGVWSKAYVCRSLLSHFESGVRIFRISGIPRVKSRGVLPAFRWNGARPDKKARKRDGGICGVRVTSRPDLLLGVLGGRAMGLAGG